MELNTSVPPRHRVVRPAGSLIKTVSRWVGCVFIIAAVGLYGLSAFFSDLGPGQTLLGRVLVTLALYVVGGVLVGASLRKHWYLAVLEAWGPMLVGIGVIFAALGDGFDTGRLVYLVLCFVAVPVISLASGVVGWRLARVVWQVR